MKGAAIYGMTLPADCRRQLQPGHRNFGIFVGESSPETLSSSSRHMLEQIFLEDQTDGQVCWFIRKDGYAYTDGLTTHALELKVHFLGTCPRKGILKILSCTTDLLMPRPPNSGVYRDLDTLQGIDAYEVAQTLPWHKYLNGIFPISHCLALNNGSVTTGINLSTLLKWS